MAGPRLSDLAARLALNGSTVSRALRGDPRISAETRARVEEAAREAGYRPNLAARALAEGKTRNVWFIIPHMEHPIDRAGAAPAARRLLQAGYDLLVVQHHDERSVYERVLDRLGSGGADAAIVIPPSFSDGAAETALNARGIPIVYFDRHIEGAPIPVVTTDNEDAVRALFAALTSAARDERLPYDAIVNGIGGAWKNSVEIRRGRVLRACAQARAHDDRTFYIEENEIEARLAGGGPDTALALAQAPEACRLCLFASDSSRIERMKARAERALGRPVAADAGIFDEWKVFRGGYGRIAVALQDFAAMGEAAAELVLKRLQAPSAESGPPAAETAAVLVPFRGIGWETVSAVGGAT